VVQVSTSEFATGVVTRSGRLYTFGVGTGGRLGHADTKIRLIPKRVMGPFSSKRVSWVSMGHAHAAVVLDDGSVFTWGSGDCGQLGHGSTEDSLCPKKIRSRWGEEHAVSISAGRHHTVVLTAKGTVWAFGYGGNGELGFPTDPLAKKPHCHCAPRQVVCIGTPVASVTVGKIHTACATHAGDVLILGFGSPEARKLLLPAVSTAQAYRSLSLSSSLSSSSSLDPTPIHQTPFSLLSDKGAASPTPAPTIRAGVRGFRQITSMTASGNMTLVVVNQRQMFLSDLYRVEGLHSRLPKPAPIPLMPGNHAVVSVALSTTKEIMATTDRGHLWKCVESRSKPGEWVWHRISVINKRFTQVVCSRNHYAAINHREMSSRQTIDVRRWRLSDHLLDQLKNDHFTDVEFVLDDGHRLTAHKIVLVMRCKKFAQMCSPQRQATNDQAGGVWGEDAITERKEEIKLGQVASPLLHNFIRFVYTDFDHNRALHRAPSSEIAALAERFGMDLNKWDRATKGKEPAHAPTGRPVLSNRFEADMRQAFTDALFTDVDLISSEGERIPCHKVILCSQSEVLHTMMTVGMIESRRSEIHIQNATTDTLRKMKEFLYLGTLTELETAAQQMVPQRHSHSDGGKRERSGTREIIPFNQVMELLNISNQFMLQRMKEMLESLLLEQYLDLDNFVSLLITAERYMCQHLKRQLFEFARRNIVTILTSNITKDLIEKADQTDLLDDLDFFIQSGGKLRVEEKEEQRRTAAERESLQEKEEEKEDEEKERDENDLLGYFTEEEIQRQREIAAFWERERQIEKERENMKANEQRRRAAKARAAKARAAKARGKRRTTSSSSTHNPQSEQASTTLSSEKQGHDDDDDEEERKERAVLMERATQALASHSLGNWNEELSGLAKRLRSAKKKLIQVDQLKDKRNKGEYLNEAQLDKLQHEAKLVEELTALILQITSPPPPAPNPSPLPCSQSPTPISTPVASANIQSSAPAGPVAYRKKPDSDELFFLSKPPSRNKRAKKPPPTTVPVMPLTQPPPTLTTAPSPSKPPPLAPWATKSPPATTAKMPHKGVPSLLQIQEEQRRLERQSAGGSTTPTDKPLSRSHPQPRMIKRLTGAVEKEELKPSSKTTDSGEASNSQYSLSLAFAGKQVSASMAIPQRAGRSVSNQQTPSPSPSPPSPAGWTPPKQQHKQASPLPLFQAPSTQRPLSLMEIQQEEEQRIQGERKRREAALKPVKRSLLKIQSEQQEARNVQDLYGNEIRQIYGHDVDLEFIW